MSFTGVSGDNVLTVSSIYYTALIVKGNKIMLLTSKASFKASQIWIQIG